MDIAGPSRGRCKHEGRACRPPACEARPVAYHTAACRAAPQVGAFLAAPSLRSTVARTARVWYSYFTRGGNRVVHAWQPLAERKQRPMVPIRAFRRPHVAAVLSMLVLGSVLGAASGRAAEVRVELEVVSEAPLVATEAAAWSALLTQVGFSSVRVRVGQDAPALVRAGTATLPVYRVVGVITPQGQLVLPHGRFRRDDAAAIARWLKTLREDGEEGLSVKPVAFGLLPQQLVAVQEALAVPVRQSTKGKPPRDVARQIAADVPLPFVSDPTVPPILAAGEAVQDELMGLAAGTALAALLRPLGLVLVPEKQAGQVRLRIATARQAKEFWPVGWPPKESPGQTLPELFKFLNVEIERAPLSEVVEAIRQRVQVPVLFDHVALARQKADMSTPVTLPKSHTFYARALDRALATVQLKSELRVDEAGQPFLWITSLRP